VSSNLFEDFITRYRNDRVSFVINVLHAAPEPWQQEVLEALDAGETQIAIRSGHGVGKTALLAWIMIHFLITRWPSKTVITAPSAAQLFDAAFSETKRWVRELPQVLQDELVLTTDRIALKASPDEAFISARTSRAENPEALQGVHSDYVLLVVDEASGVPEVIFEAASGSMSTPGAITVLTGNPTRRSGFFYNAHTKWQGEWWTRKVACAESSRVDPKFIEMMRKRYGVDSAAYAIRVMGEFPPAEEDTFIPYFLIDEAMHRDIQPLEGKRQVWGIDVARFGDDASVLCRRTDYYVHPLKVWHKLSTMELVGRIKIEYETTPINLRPLEIYVDVIGIGAGVVDRLMELQVPAVGINVSETPSVGSVYNRLRDELWGNVREAAEARKLILPNDEELKGELTTPRMKFLPNGKLQLESKADMKKRGLPSPDRADAVCLSFAYESSVAAGLKGATWGGNINDRIDNSFVL
jgi:hypothetical protein